MLYVFLLENKITTTTTTKAISFDDFKKPVTLVWFKVKYTRFKTYIYCKTWQAFVTAPSLMFKYSPH